MLISWIIDICKLVIPYNDRKYILSCLKETIIGMSVKKVYRSTNSTQRYSLYLMKPNAL